jgi:alkylhydroperoxidase/carboxymuconolactone decarboxylase family protein YurZ
MTLSPEQERLKAEYIRARGYWTDWTEGMLRFSPGFLDLYARYGGYPAANGPLSPLVCELIYVALDASSTHLFESGLRLHMAVAIRLGATPPQVMEVLAMATEQGLGGTRVGVEILAQELTAAGKIVPELDAALSTEQAALRDGWIAKFADWPRHADVLLRLDPAYFALALELSAYADSADRLTEKDRILVRIALDACFTGLNQAGLREGIRQAIMLGVEWRAILQVLQLTAHLGVHACAVGVPALATIVDRCPGP